MGRGQSLGHRWQQGSTTSARTSFVKRWVFASYFQRLLCAVESIRHMPPIMSIMPPMSTPGNGLPPPPPTCDWSPGLGTPRKPPHQSRQSHPYPGSRPFCRPFGLQACRHRQNRQARRACLGSCLLRSHQIRRSRLAALTVVTGGCCASRMSRPWCMPGQDWQCTKEPSQNGADRMTGRSFSKDHLTGQETASLREEQRGFETSTCCWHCGTWHAAGALHELRKAGNAGSPTPVFTTRIALRTS